MKNCEAISGAAFAAAAEVAGEDVAELLEGAARWDEACSFVSVAGDVPGESLYRFMSARGLHPLPADGYASLTPGMRLFFEAFTATVKALAPLLDPPKQAPIVAPPPAAPRGDDDAYARNDAPFARTHAGAAGPRSTAAVFVSRPAEALAPETADALAELRLAARAQVMEFLRSAEPPEPPEPLDPVEALRAAARALPGNVGEIERERPASAPALPAPVEAMTLEDERDGAVQVGVARPVGASES